MAQFDMPLAEMRTYAPQLAVPADLAGFWDATLADARSHDLAATFERVDSGLATIETFDVTYAGFDGASIRAWLHLPAGRTGRLPAVVLAAELGLAVVANRPFGEGGLLRRRFPTELATAGLAGWAEALLRWVLADERVAEVIPATASPEHATANVAVGSLPLLDSDLRGLIGRLAGG